MLPPVKELEVLTLTALPQGCSDEGLLVLESDTVVLPSSFGSKSGELICFFFAFSNFFFYAVIDEDEDDN